MMANCNMLNACGVVLLLIAPLVCAQQGLSPREAKEMCVDVGAAEHKYCVETMTESGGGQITVEIAKYLCTGVTEDAKNDCVDKYLALNYAGVTGPNAGGLDDDKAAEMCTMVPASEAEKCVKYMLKYGQNKIEKEDAEYLCEGAKEIEYQGCMDGFTALNYEGMTGGGLNDEDSRKMCEDVGDDPDDKKKCEDYMKHSGAAPITNSVANMLCAGNDDSEEYKACVTSFLALNHKDDASKALSEKDATEMCVNAASKKRDGCIDYMKRNGNAPITVALATFLCAGAADKHKCSNNMVLMNYATSPDGPNAGGLSAKKADEMCLEVPEIEREKCEEYMEKYGKNPLTAEDVAYLCAAATEKDYDTCKLSFDSINTATGPTAGGVDAKTADALCEGQPAGERDSCVDLMRKEGKHITYDIAGMLCSGVPEEQKQDCVGTFLTYNYQQATGGSGSSGSSFKAVTTTISRASPRFRGTAHILNGPH